ncbi:MAG: zinc finger Ran-binding domain-containing protein [archaeon]|nr:zinc finger Ran-binding domain-containing protein [archaeon]
MKVRILNLLLARKKCNRCGEDKKPRTLSEIKKKKGETAEIEKKKNKEHKKDWICSYCGNLNYGFRKNCNRCQVSKSSQQVVEVDNEEEVIGYNNFRPMYYMGQPYFPMGQNPNLIQNMSPLNTQMNPNINHQFMNPPPFNYP